MKTLIGNLDNSKRQGFIEFLEPNKSGLGKTVHMKPEIGFHCVVDRIHINNNWVSQAITEVISENEFKTTDNHYIIEK